MPSRKSMVNLGRMFDCQVTPDDVCSFAAIGSIEKSSWISSVESKLWEFVEPSGWREIPPLDFLIIFTIATHRFSYTFGAATFVNGLQLGYIRLYPDDPMQAHNPLMNHFHPFLTSRMLISSDMISHSVFPRLLSTKICPIFRSFSSLLSQFSRSHRFSILFPNISTSFPPVFHHFGHLRGGQGLNAAIDACASAGETSQGWRLLRLAEGIPRSARDVSSLPWALARPRGMARRDGG